ncbi:MAG: trigger factor [Armatimonadetes bacterium]|nr:trigger factor [Armatimonadota bacterium]
MAGILVVSDQMSTATDMQVTSEELNPCTVLLTVHCSPEQVRAGFTKAYRRASKRVRIPGFRPGAAPKALVQQYANPEYVRKLAQDAIVREAYDDAMKQEGLKAHGPPRIEVTKLEEDASECEFSAKVPLEPKVELGDQESLEVKRPAVEVTDEEVDEQIDDMRRRRATRQPIESRGAQEGDFAVVVIQPEGEEEEEASKTFMTVVGETFPQLDQQLMGMGLEDTKRADLTFPSDFQEADWAGKPFPCRIRITSLSAPVLPDLTDDFAQRFSAASVDELRAKVREQVQAAKERMVEDYVNEQLIQKLIQSSIVHMPDTMWERVADQRIGEIAEEAGRKGLTPKDVAESNNMTVEQLQERVCEEARQEVRRALLITEVFKQEGMKVTKEDVAEQIAGIAAESGLAPQDVARALRRGGNQNEINYRVMSKKVLGLLRERAQMLEETGQTL